MFDPIGNLLLRRCFWTDQGSQVVGVEGVTLFDVAGFEPFGEPADALFRGSVRERVGNHVALGLHLEAVVAETLAGRRAEAARGEQLVAEEAERFRTWRASLDVVPAIASLRARAEAIRSAELAKVEDRMTDDERRTIARWFKGGAQ